MGRFFVNAGVLLIVVGLLVMLGEKAGIRLGRLPGDIRIEGARGGFYFPVVTCILISAALSLISWLLSKR